jgi:hypothetical protein
MTIRHKVEWNYHDFQQETSTSIIRGSNWIQTSKLPHRYAYLTLATRNTQIPCRHLLAFEVGSWRFRAPLPDDFCSVYDHRLSIN